MDNVFNQHYGFKGYSSTEIIVFHRKVIFIFDILKSISMK